MQLRPIFFLKVSRGIFSAFLFGILKVNSDLNIQLHITSEVFMKLKGFYGLIKHFLRKMISY